MEGQEDRAQRDRRGEGRGTPLVGGERVEVRPRRKRGQSVEGRERNGKWRNEKAYFMTPNIVDLVCKSVQNERVESGRTRG